MANSFWGDFLANFLSDLLVGAILGTALALWVGKRINDLQRSQRRKDEKRAELEKAVRYIDLLQDEIRHLINHLPESISSFEETGWGREIMIPTPFWDVLQPSGELPRLLQPQVLASLTLFYDYLSYAKRGKDKVIEAWLVSEPESVSGMKEKLKAFIDMTLFGLKNALDFGRNLPDKLDSEIRDIKAQLKAL